MIGNEHVKYHNIFFEATSFMEVHLLQKMSTVETKLVKVTSAKNYLETLPKGLKVDFTFSDWDDTLMKSRSTEAVELFKKMYLKPNRGNYLLAVKSFCLKKRKSWWLAAQKQRV